MLSGAKGWCRDCAPRPRQTELLRFLLPLAHGIPSHDTFSRLFRLLEPARFHARFFPLMQRSAADLAGVVAVDGKALRRSFDRASAQSPLHPVRAWAADQRLVLAQVAVDGKSDEITAVPALLSLNGTIFTADAMHCQHGTAGQVVGQQGDWVLALKANEGTLHDEVRHVLDESPSLPVNTHTKTDKDHDRIEIRTSVVSTEIAWLQAQQALPGPAAAGKVPRTRESRGEVSTETAYYLLSTALSAERFGQIVRQHWGMENSLHWALDVTGQEDQAR